MNTFPELPAIFIIPQSERAAAWKGRKLTRQGSGFTGLDREEEKRRNRLLNEYKKQRAIAERARLAALRDRDND